jgi:hypothetical protein
MKSPFIRAHGYVPGPTERPISAGFFAGVVAFLPALAVAAIGGALSAAASDLRVATVTLILQLALLFSVAGAVYGWLFMRAANDRRGAWLFGLSYGFLTWMLGPATVLQWIFGRPIVMGVPAQFLLGTHLVYGLVLGLSFPHVGVMLRRRLRGAKITML